MSEHDENYAAMSEQPKATAPLECDCVARTEGYMAEAVHTLDCALITRKVKVTAEPPRPEAHQLNLEGAKLQLAGAIRATTGSLRFRADHSAIDIFAQAVLNVAASSGVSAAPLGNQGGIRTWQQVALRVGEELSRNGPNGYYEMGPEEWQDWCLAQIYASREGVSAARLRELEKANAIITLAIPLEEELASRIDEALKYLAMQQGYTLNGLARLLIDCQRRMASDWTEIGSVRREVKALAAALQKDLQTELVISRGLVIAAEAERDDARETIQQLRSYVQHRDSCEVSSPAWMWDSGTSDGKRLRQANDPQAKCTCKLDDVLKTLEGNSPAIGGEK